MIKVNPLMTVNSIRDLPIAWYWIERMDFTDKLIVKNSPLHSAHNMNRNYFLEHKEYSHLLIYAEDIMTTPDIVELLLEDAEDNDFPVVSAWFNWDFKTNWASLTYKDMRRLKVWTAEQYGFVDMQYFLREENLKKVGYPFTQVFFIGLPLTLIRRDVVEKVTLKPYKEVTDSLLGQTMKRGTMHDLQFCIECKNLGIPVTVDIRALVTHFGNTINLVNMKGKEPRIEFIPKVKN